MKIKNIFNIKKYSIYVRMFYKKNFKNAGKISYAQLGEDLVIDFIFKQLKISKPTYLDIGAHHPIRLNNTYFFYKKGSNGICIEPNPQLYKKLARIRKHDICLNIGVSANEEKIADYYVMSESVLNTFSKREAEHLVKTTSKKIEKIIKIPLIPINKIIEEYFNGKIPNFISLDTESNDFEILKSLNFRKFKPEIFCIETLTYTENKTERKINEIIDFMTEKNYFILADTYINTIFVDKNKWLNR